MSGEGAYTEAHRQQQRSACAIDIKEGKHYDLASPSGFASWPYVIALLAFCLIRLVHKSSASVYDSSVIQHQFLQYPQFLQFFNFLIYAKS